MSALVQAVTDLVDAASDAHAEIARQRNAQKIPGDTCPDIDAVIRDVRGAIKAAEWIRKHSECETAKSGAGDVESALWDVEDALEKLRTANAVLRDLGRTWYGIAEDNADCMTVRAQSVADALSEVPV